MSDIVKPKIDVVFKKLFTDKDNEDILKSFIAALLEIEETDITDIQIQNSEVAPDEVDGKFIRLDLNITVNNKKELNIEIQLHNYGDYRERSVYYWSKKFSGQLKAGQSYDELKPTIAFNILDFNLFKTEDYFSEFKLVDEKHDEVLTDKCSIQFFELRKIGKTPDLNDRKRLWMQLINAESEGELEMLASTNVSSIVRGCNVVRDMSSDKALRTKALQKEKAIRDEISALKYARKEGIKEGIKEGEEKGRNSIIEGMRKSGMTEEEIQQVLLYA